MCTCVHTSQDQENKQVSEIRDHDCLCLVLQVTPLRYKMDVKSFLIFLVIFRVVVFLFRLWVQGGRCTSKARLDGKVAVITGANTGIGRETARDLARRGAEVHLLCRDGERGEITRREIKMETGREVFVHKVDLASIETVRECTGCYEEGAP